ncbi:hypothetical protein PWR63_22180 [Paraburkholderia sp. A2WS-5]|jgi:hypothetical protein|uniref:hypothetical protein n=1 Tax=unclassified Paraburkholderia TaxID=2615204 RepID=UPI003B77A3F5
MQIVYLGFAGTAAIEAEAGVQLLRLERFSGLLKACHLAIESVRKSGHADVYDVRLDLLSAASELKPIVHSTGEDPIAAMREVFDAAEHELRRAGTSGCAAQDGRMRRDH